MITILISMTMDQTILSIYKQLRRSIVSMAIKHGKFVSSRGAS